MSISLFSLRNSSQLLKVQNAQRISLSVHNILSPFDLYCTARAYNQKQIVTPFNQLLYQRLFN